MGYIKSLLLLSIISTGLSACVSRELAQRQTAITPQECWDIFDFRVNKFRRGRTTDGQLAVWLAKEGNTRQNEIGKSVVCAAHAIKTDAILSDKDKKSALAKLDRKYKEYKDSLTRTPKRRIRPEF